MVAVLAEPLEGGGEDLKWNFTDILAPDRRRRTTSATLLQVRTWREAIPVHAPLDRSNQRAPGLQPLVWCHRGQRSARRDPRARTATCLER